MAETGKYLVFEGIEGTGKSTQAMRLAKQLTQAGQTVVEMVEPGSTPIGVEMRKIVLGSNIDLQPETIADLFTAIRRESVNQIIRPATLRGDTVISDRNWFSTV